MAHIFDPKKLDHLESPERAEWQKPEEIVKAVSISRGSTIVDFGAGTGYFSVFLAETTSVKGMVIAIDIQGEMLDYLKSKLLLRAINNIFAIRNDGLSIPLASKSIDLVFIANTFHELRDRGRVLTEFKRILKENGRMVIVDWAPLNSPMGPPISERLSVHQVVQLLKTGGFSLKQDHPICNYHYVLEFVAG